MSIENTTRTLIQSSRVIPLNVPIHVPFTISRESLLTAHIILVEIANEKGLKGLGECAPFPSLTHDTMTSAEAVARELLDAIQGCTTLEALERLRSLKAEAIQRSITGFVGVEGALWDLHAREAELPLTALWGGGRQKHLESDITLPIMSPAAIPGFWELYSSYAFGTIKVKVSGHIGQDLDMIRALQTIVPSETQYVLDGNQGFKVDDAKALVASLQTLGIKPLFFERPLPEDDFRGLLSLSKALPIPVCADESVRTLKDLERLLEADMKPIVNIKLMKSGIEESLRIIALAKQHGCPLMIGGMLESEVGMGLSLQMACGTEAIQFADLDTPFFFKDKVCIDSPWQRFNAHLHLPTGNGHGLTRSV